MIRAEGLAGDAVEYKHRFGKRGKGAFIAPYWVNFHAEHHLFMHVPCWKLPRLHQLLRSKPEGARMEVAPGYLSVLRLATRG